MMIDNALDLVYAYLATICKEDELPQIAEELINIAGTKKYKNYHFKAVQAFPYAYADVQNMLSKLNEKESIRKSKGVYYTPCDVVRFIVVNSIKASFGKLNPDNIGNQSLDSIPYRAFALKKSVFDPTCGVGEYLLFALEMKYDLLDQHDKKISAQTVAQTVATIFGNDINEESVAITKLRLLLCSVKRYGVKRCYRLSKVMKPNFYSYDYVQQQHKQTYHIIVGNPPYVEDLKSGLDLSVRYGNIYANVLVNAAKQLDKNGSIGFIIPLSYISTPRMSMLRSELIACVTEQYILSYADRPDCLFHSVHQKLCILIGRKKKNCRRIYTGNYQYWYKEERKYLFDRTHVVRNKFFSDHFIPKLGTEYDIAIFQKITNPKRMKSVYEVSRMGNESVYLNRREAFWMKAYREKVDDPEYKSFHFKSKQEADYCYCLIQSSLFWWYWISTSDCWHVSKELNGFMAPFNGKYVETSRLADALRNRLEETKVYVGTKQTKYEYKHKKCIKEIHEIDDYINALFGLTQEESYYIKNFALRYRTSGGAGLT